MLVKTRGVVLKFIKYRETSIIVNIYTECLGLQGYIINGIRSFRTKRNKIALYQPLTLLDLVVYYREEKQLQRLSEAKCQHPFYSITLKPKKSGIALFILEILSKTLKEQTENKDLFNFLWDSILKFDSGELPSENFHLVFLVQLSKFLGFRPQSAKEIHEELRSELNEVWLHSPESQLMDQMLTCSYTNSPALSNSQRANLLKILLSFYRWNIEQFGTVKSLDVLNQVFK